MPPDLVTLTPEEKIGKFMIFDTFLSDPPGYACTTCHILDAGNTGPSSRVNEFAGTMPGVRPNRWSNRKPQTYGYAAFSPYGPYFDNNLGVWIGGNFWDGRVVDLVGQAQQPPINPVEMANTPTPTGDYPPVFGGYSALLAEKLQTQALHPRCSRRCGARMCSRRNQRNRSTSALPRGSRRSRARERSVNSARSGTPPSMARRRRTSIRSPKSEERGRILYGSGPNPSNDPKFGGAQCFACHDSTGLANGTGPASDVPTLTQGKNTFTMYCYANIGVPKNVNNHYYLETDCQSNPRV